MANLADYWKTAVPVEGVGGKADIVNNLPKSKPKQNRRCRKCKHADAHECAVERRVLGWAGYGHVTCDCECHRH